MFYFFLLLFNFFSLLAMNNALNEDPISVTTAIAPNTPIIIDPYTKRIVSLYENNINFWDMKGQLVEKFTNNKPDRNNNVAVAMGALYASSKCGSEQVLSIFDKKTLQPKIRQFIPNAGNIKQLEIHKATGNIYLYDDHNSQTEYNRFMYVFDDQGRLIKTINPTQYGFMHSFAIDQITGNIIINSRGSYDGDVITTINLDGKKINSFKPSPENGFVACKYIKTGADNNLWCSVQSTVQGDDDILLNVYNLEGTLIKQLNKDDELSIVGHDINNFALADNNTVTYFANQRDNYTEKFIKITRPDGGQKYIKYPNNNPNLQIISIDMDKETNMIAATLDSNGFIIANQ